MLILLFFLVLNDEQSIQSIVYLSGLIDQFEPWIFIHFESSKENERISQSNTPRIYHFWLNLNLRIRNKSFDSKIKDVVTSATSRSLILSEKLHVINYLKWFNFDARFFLLLFRISIIKSNLIWSSPNVSSSSNDFFLGKSYNFETFLFFFVEKSSQFRLMVISFSCLLASSFIKLIYVFIVPVTVLSFFFASRLSYLDRYPIKSN